MKKFLKVCVLLIGGYFFLNYGLFLLWVYSANGSISKEKNTMLSLSRMVGDIKTYAEENKRLPVSLNELYENSKNDWWGNQIIYIKSLDQVTLISKGANGILDDNSASDDIRKVADYAEVNGNLIIDYDENEYENLLFKFGNDEEFRNLFFNMLPSNKAHDDK